MIVKCTDLLNSEHVYRIMKANLTRTCHTIEPVCTLYTVRRTHMPSNIQHSNITTWINKMKCKKKFTIQPDEEMKMWFKFLFYFRTLIFCKIINEHAARCWCRARIRLKHTYMQKHNILHEAWRQRFRRTFFSFIAIDFFLLFYFLSAKGTKIILFYNWS